MYVTPPCRACFPHSTLHIPKEFYHYPEHLKPKTMDLFRRMFNTQLVLTHGSSPPTEPWTTHDSNLELLKCLSTATPARPAIPTEIILQILDHPSRWLHIHSIYHPPLPNSRPLLIIRDKPSGDPVLYTRSFSARDAKVLRRVIFTFRSRDQGWCSNPNNGAWSWFEASLARFPRDDEEGQPQLSDDIVTRGPYDWVYPWLQRHSEELGKQPRYKIQENKIGEKEPESYRIVLGDDHELVQRVREGDRIILWACACFPGWNNHVYEAQISIEGVDDLRMEKIAGPSVTNNEG